jgi:hypothetical protein
MPGGRSAVFSAAFGCSIPKGLRPPAQGCEERATLGAQRLNISTPTGLWLTNIVRRPNGNSRNRVAVGDMLWAITQGSSFLATLGLEPESRWDSSS